jgi:hypothetical protein
MQDYVFGEIFRPLGRVELETVGRAMSRIMVSAIVAAALLRFLIVALLVTMERRGGGLVEGALIWRQTCFMPRAPASPFPKNARDRRCAARRLVPSQPPFCLWNTERKRQSPAPPAGLWRVTGRKISPDT